MKKLSILIPTYNGVCTTLVGELQRQAEALGGDYEIIVADDGSTDIKTVEANRAINALPHCRYVEHQPNVGRAAIRNFLATQAHYDWLLFIDSDMVVCREDFVKRYAESPESDRVIDGGVVIGNIIPGNLRSEYEKASEQAHTAERRQLSPYHDFHTANFLVQRDLMLAHPFDLRFRHYGYEDVLFGKQMKEAGVPITHIDNPLSFEVFESNADFISKTEEGLRTLYQFRNELQGYSRLLDFSNHLSAPVAWLLRMHHRLLGSWERRQLTGPHPSLTLFKAYKTGYFLSLNGL